MRHWFSDYRGPDWTPARGYNDLFASTCEDLKVWFYLKHDRARQGFFKGEEWCRYAIHGDTKAWPKSGGVYYVAVNMCSVKWNEYFFRNSRPIIRWRMRTRIMWDTPTANTPFFDDEIIVVFPHLYPAFPPDFFADKYRNYSASHEHHLLSNGQLCVYRSSSDWQADTWLPGSDTIVTATNRAISWIVLHYKQFGN